MTSTAHSAASLEQAIIPDPIIVAPDTPLEDVVLLMRQAQEDKILAASYPPNHTSYLEQARAGCVLVARHAQLMGIFTTQDVVRFAASGRQLGSLQVGQVILSQTVSLRRSQLQNPFIALRLLQQHQLTHLPIVDDQQTIVGMVTAETLYRSITPPELLKFRAVSSAMTTDVVRAPLGASILTIAKLMTEHHTNHVIITNNEGSGTLHPELLVYPVGMLTGDDILQAQAILQIQELNRRDFSTIPASAIMQTPLACLSMQDSLWTGYQKMQRYHTQYMVVIGSQGELVGVLNSASLNQFLEPAEMHLLIETLHQRVNQLEKTQAELEHLRHRTQQELTQQRAAYQRLQTQEAIHQKLLETVDTGIWVFDKDQQTSFVNQYVLAALGYTLEDMLGKPLEAFVEGDDQATLPTSDAMDDPPYPVLYRSVLQVPDTQAVTHQELRLRCKDHSHRWMLLSKRSLHNDAQEYMGSVITLTDLDTTNLLNRQLHQLLQKTSDSTGQEFLDVLVQQLADVLSVACVQIATLDDDRLQTWALWANGQLQPTISYAIAPTPDRHTLRNGEYCCAQELERHFPQAKSRILSKLESYLGVVLKTADGNAIGTIALMDTKPMLMTHSLKMLLQTFVPRVVMEIDRQQAIEALQHTVQNLQAELEQQSLVIQDVEQRFCDIADNMPVFLWMAFDREMRWFSNRAWEDFTGRNRKELEGHGWTEYLHPEDTNRYIDDYLRAFDARKPLEVEYRLRKETGEYSWILDLASPYYRPDNSFAGYVGIGVDITSYKYTINALNKALETQQQEGNQRFTSVVNIMRQFRSPLASIITHTRELASEITYNNGTGKHLSILQAASKQLAELLENGLVANQVDDSELVFAPELVNLVQVCEEFVNQMKVEHPKYNFRTNFWQEGIRGDRQLSRVIMDPKLLRRALHCLVSNAVKYSAEGSNVYVKLVKGLKGQELVAIEVQDEGVGIPPEVQTKLFQPFRRGKNVRDVQGDGLGLVVAQRCLHLHDGGEIILAESKPGHTLFRILLPVQYAREDTSHGGGDSMMRV
jgi:PAS domain S-box-containing protein